MKMNGKYGMMFIGRVILTADLILDPGNMQKTSSSPLEPC